MSRPFPLIVAAAIFVLPPLRLIPAGESITGMVHPRLSPNGQSIACSFHGSIAICSSDGGILQKLTRAPGWDIEPTWSPDGERIAFIRSPNFYGGTLCLLDVATGEEPSVPSPARCQGKLTFSADGNRILGSFRKGAEQPTVSWFDLETGDLEPLEFPGNDPENFRYAKIRFALSADGQKLAYVLQHDAPDEQGGNRGPHSDLYVSDALGNGSRKICTWPARIYDLAFASDGSLILVTDLGASHNDLWVVPISNPLKKAQRITSNFADDDRPSFDQDRSSMVWTDNFGGTTSFRIRDLESGQNDSIPLTEVDHGEPVTQLSLNLVDQSTGAPVTARVTIRKADGKFYFPTGSDYRLTGRHGHFYSSGGETISLPRGEYEVRVRRGPEYRTFSETITLEEAPLELRAELNRWIDMNDRNWYSGENHIHANYGYGEWYNTPKAIIRQIEGEDLNVGNLVIANSDGDAIFDREFFRGQLDPRSTGRHLVYYGEEFRSTIWGHMTLSNLTRLVEPIMTGFPGTTNPYDVPTNADIAEQVGIQGGTVGYTHPAGNLIDLYDQPYSAKGLPVDAALGRVLLMDIHGHTYEGSIRLWYRLLNCDLRVIGTAGTDVFLNRVRSYPPGWARTYVHLPEGLKYGDWIRNQKQGRSFFTNGPMLTLKAGGKGIGDEIILEEPGSVSVEATVESIVPLDRIEVVHNGNVVKSIPVSEEGIRTRFEGDVEIEESGWIALRAHGPAHEDVIRDPNAHTNPIWIRVSRKPNSNRRESAAYFLKWINRLEGDVMARKRIPSASQLRHVRNQLNDASEFYQRLLR